MGRLDNQNNTTSTTTGRLPKAQTNTQPVVQTRTKGNFVTNAPSNIGALFRGEIPVSEVAKRIPGTAYRGAIKTAQTVAPALSNFTETTGGILGEGLAYAIDPNVREQYKNPQADKGQEEILRRIREGREKGEDVTPWVKSLEKLQNGQLSPSNNLDILPTVSKTTQGGLLKDTAAAALEATIIRSVPAALKGKIVTRAGIGGLEGIGLAIAEGMAKDQSADEILKNAALYGVSGSALNVAIPWLSPLLKKELSKAPSSLKNALKQEAETGISASTPDVRPEDEATSVISYINKDDEKVYTTLTKDELESLRDEVKMIPEPQKGESQIHLDAKTPTLESQGKFVSREEFIAGHSQAGEVLQKTKATQSTPSGVQQVQGEQIPIGGPTKGASRLEARLVAQTEDPAYQSGVSNYQKYANAADAPEVTGATNREQIKRAAQSVESLSEKEINDIASGIAELPPGVLRTAFLKAATEKAILEGNSSLVNRLARAAGQLARRFGQEIQFTKNFDPLDPVNNIADIISVRLKAVERRLPKGETVSTYIKRNSDNAKKQLNQNQLKIKEAEDLIDSILC